MSGELRKTRFFALPFITAVICHPFQDLLCLSALFSGAYLICRPLVISRSHQSLPNHQHEGLH